MSAISSYPASRIAPLAVAAGAIVAIAADAVVALTAVAAGASASYAPLTLPVYGAFSVVGIVAGFLGWRQVVRRSHNPRTTLAWLVPVVLVASFIPDVVLLATGFIPGTTVTGAVALMIMHVVVAAVVVPLSAKVAPAN